mmetsp:Transcript_7946/g.10918  ORF Transcript_7946/g.10918 Transcript_7946/m.10918 type:complete len:282 (+) Transcript_7946:584-1429(+)
MNMVVFPKLLHSFHAICVVGFVLVDKISADVAVAFFDNTSNSKLVLRRNFFPTITKKLQNKIRDIAASKGNMFDTTPNNISINHWYDMSHSISRINNSPCHSSILSFSTKFCGTKCQDSLYSDVQTGYIKCLEHDLCGVFTIFRRVQRRFSQHNIVFFWIETHVLEDTSLPVFLHVVPTINYSMLDWVVNIISPSFFHSFIPYIEIQVRNTGGQSSLSCFLFIFGGDNGRDDKIRLIVSSVTHLCVPRSIVNDGRRARCGHFCRSVNRPSRFFYSFSWILL